MDKYLGWDDVDALREVLVGRRIVNTRTKPGATGDDVIFTLDNGVEVEAQSADGGCACSNGCFTVNNPSPIGGTIMSVEAVDPSDGEWAAGDTALRVFVFTEFGKQDLIVSEGGDNGYYGWGFSFTVREPEVVPKAVEAPFIPVVLVDYPHIATSGPMTFLFPGPSDRSSEAEKFASEYLEKNELPGQNGYREVYIGAVKWLNPRG